MGEEKTLRVFSHVGDNGLRVVLCLLHDDGISSSLMVSRAPDTAASKSPLSRTGIAARDLVREEETLDGVEDLEGVEDLLMTTNAQVR